MSKSTKYIRPSWDEYFLKIMEIVGTRATCDRGRSGSVIVRDKRILTTGYVGSAPGVPHCDEAGHEMHKVINEDGTSSQHCIRTIHAEQNAIAQASKIGVSIDGATIYCKMVPCYVCAKIIANAGIKRVVSLMDYHAGARSKKLFKQSKIKLDILNKSVENYLNQ